MAVVAGCGSELVSGTGAVRGFVSTVQCAPVPPVTDPDVWLDPARAPVCRDARTVVRESACVVEHALKAFRFTRQSGGVVIEMRRRAEARRATNVLWLRLAAEQDLAAQVDVEVAPALGNTVALVLNEREAGPMAVVGLTGTLRFTEVGRGLPRGSGRLTGRMSLRLGTAASCDEADGTADPAARLDVEFSFDAEQAPAGRPGGLDPTVGDVSG